MPPYNQSPERRSCASSSVGGPATETPPPPVYRPESGGYGWAPLGSGVPSQPVVEAPPTHLLWAYRAINWQLPERYRSWVAQDLARPHARWYFPARVLGFGLLGFLISLVADDVILFHPTFSPGFFLIPGAFVVGFALLNLTPAVSAQRIASTRRRQALEGTPRGNNASLVAFLILLQVFLIWIAVGAARTAHAKVCAGGGTAGIVRLDSLIEPPAGFFG